VTDQPVDYKVIERSTTPVLFFPKKKVDYRFVPPNGLWYKNFSTRKNLVLELTPNLETNPSHACEKNCVPLGLDLVDRYPISIQDLCVLGETC